MKISIRDYAPLITIAGIIIIADQITKYLVRINIPMGGLWAPWPWLAPYARIVHWENTGAAFGMFQNFNIVFTILAIVVSIAILYYFPRVSREEWPLRLAMGMQLGGAIGNLIDRLHQGYVTDFVSLGNFAVFNVADASISVGVVVLILGVWVMDQSQKKSKGIVSEVGSTSAPLENATQTALPASEPAPSSEDPSSNPMPDSLHPER